MLNPKFHHFYYSDYKNRYIAEKAVNILDSCDAVRFKTVASYDLYEKFYEYDDCVKYYEKRDFLDSNLANFSEYNLYNFSLKYGIYEQLEFLRGYDRVLLCDVGGDILYAGETNCEIKTPIIDAYSLMLARQYENAGGECEMYILAPGSDKELSPEHLKENLDRVDSVAFDIDETALRKLWSLYGKIRFGDSGKTIQRIYAASNINKGEKKEFGYGILLRQIHKCDLKKAVALNPLSQLENLDEILANCKSIGLI